MTNIDIQNTVRILYVEDEDVLQEIISEYLQIIGGYQVHCANNGQEGVDMAKAWKPDFVLMDVRMPIMDGIEAIRLIRDAPETSNTIIYALSAYSDKTILSRCEEAGADGYFIKPPDFHAMISTIRQETHQLKRS